MENLLFSWRSSPGLVAVAGAGKGRKVAMASEGADRDLLARSWSLRLRVLPAAAWAW